MPRGTDRVDEARRQGRLWDITDLRGRLASYNNFNRLETLSFSGSEISSATDLSGNGLTLANSSGFGLGTPPRAALNQRWVADFVASPGDELSQATASVGTGATTYTIIILGKMGTSKQRLLGGQSANYLVGEWQGAQNSWFDGGAFRAGPGGASDTSWHTYVVRSSAGVPYMRNNGAVITTSGTVGGGPGRFVLSVAAGGDGASDCQVFAVATATVAWTLDEIYKAEGALAWEAGLQDTVLPASHPFRNRPPLIGD